MSELIAAGILFVIVLSDPCFDKIFTMLRRTAQKQIASDDCAVAGQPARSCKRDVA
jgi:hypothetical protein